MERRFHVVSPLYILHRTAPDRWSSSYCIWGHVMKRTMLFVLICLLASCSRGTVPSDAVRRWAASHVVVARDRCATHSFRRPDGTWAIVSTARLDEDGLVYVDGEILKSGFFVYPGGARADNLDQALALLAEIETGIVDKPRREDGFTQPAR